MREVKKLDAQLTLHIWPSTGIHYAYFKNNYIGQIDSLGNSCMRTKEMQKALNFYVKNKVRIVVLTDKNNKIYARALLWDNVKSKKWKIKKCTYLDRVYYVKSSYAPLFWDMAEKKKWLFYPSTSAGDAETYFYKDDITIEGITHLPYTDTFRYLFYKDNIITSGHRKSVEGNDKLDKIKHPRFSLSLTTTAVYGYHREIDPNSLQEAITANWVSKRDCVFIKKYDGYVLKRNIVDINGAYYSTHDKDICNTQLDGWILKSNSVKEAITGIKIDKTKAIDTKKYKGFVHKSNIVKIHNEIYHKQDPEIIMYDGKGYHISQCFINYNREKVNKEIEELFNGEGGATAEKQQLIFFDSTFPYIPYEDVMAEKPFIPKECTTIVYNLFYNPILEKVEYQEVYYLTSAIKTMVMENSLTKLATGELIINNAKNRENVKKFNKKYYLRSSFEQPNKNQSLLFDAKGQ